MHYQIRSMAWGYQTLNHRASSFSSAFVLLSSFYCHGHALAFTALEIESHFLLHLAVNQYALIRLSHAFVKHNDTPELYIIHRHLIDAHIVLGVAD